MKCVKVTIPDYPPKFYSYPFTNLSNKDLCSDALKNARDDKPWGENIDYSKLKSEVASAEECLKYDV